MAVFIERDHINDGRYAERRLTGPFELRSGPLTEELPLPSTDDDGKELPRIQFRAYDDDAELYYEGWLHDDWNCDNQIALLVWAQADVGVTTVRVRRGGEWRQEIQ